MSLAAAAPAGSPRPRPRPLQRGGYGGRIGPRFNRPQVGRGVDEGDRRAGALSGPWAIWKASEPETADFGAWIYLSKEYFVIRKMKRSSKAAVTGVRKSVHPSLVKGRKVTAPRTEKTDEAPLTQKDIAAIVIQRAWLSHMDKTIFQLLKHTICAAEYCVTHEILKNVSPLEAELVKDPSIKCKVRFRFSGETFPPSIVFKIFLHTGGHGYKYFSGKNILRQSRKASTDAYKIMGRKKFHEQIIEDELLSQKFKITDEIDILTLQDYMQYCSLLDKTPASSGGRNNCWRRLNLRNIPRTMIMYDIVNFAESGVISNRLQKEMKYLLQRPRTEEMRQNQLRIVSEVRYSSSVSSSRPLRRPYQQQSQIKHLGRRATQAQMKVEKTKQAYGMAKEANTSVRTERQTDTANKKYRQRIASSSFDIVEIKELKLDNKLEENKKRPFAWCQEFYIHRFPPF
ncbi:uncharacterized protein CXorf58 homolog [Pteronotus mesoamericanus]|uniref:uncharacterized protein CXorf58 homolog n=1 Tax=Pteronotus mesoamericanus TaxID=1884717 RepID=UPI0023EAD42F|nr:uncharacterized protein CXorf58 homolog [Pteronotus parnellii mesoamericanus]